MFSSSLFSSSSFPSSSDDCTHSRFARMALSLNDTVFQLLTLPLILGSGTGLLAVQYLREFKRIHEPSEATESVVSCIVIATACHGAVNLTRMLVSNLYDRERVFECVD